MKEGLKEDKRKCGWVILKRTSEDFVPLAGGQVAEDRKEWEQHVVSNLGPTWTVALEMCVILQFSAYQFSK